MEVSYTHVVAKPKMKNEAMQIRAIPALCLLLPVVSRRSKWPTEAKILDGKN